MLGWELRSAIPGSAGKQPWRLSRSGRPQGMRLRWLRGPGLAQDVLRLTACTRQVSGRCGLGGEAGPGWQGGWGIGGLEIADAGYFFGGQGEAEDVEVLLDAFGVRGL